LKWGQAEERVAVETTGSEKAMNGTDSKETVRFVLDESESLKGWPSTHYWASCMVCGGGLLVPISAKGFPVHKCCLPEERTAVETGLY
jgi:hypothetical protein